MEGNVVAIYKKFKWFENIYIYKFVGIEEDVEYDTKDDTIIYKKNGKTRTLFSMYDLDFTISDEKYCFGDLVNKKSIMEAFEVGEDKIIDTFEKECRSFIRYGVLEPEKENLKIVDSELDAILNAKEDSHNYSYVLSYQTKENAMASFPLATIQNMLSNLEEKNIEDVQSILQSVINGFDAAKEYMEEMIADTPGQEVVEENISTEEQLNSLIGLEVIKKQVRKLKNYLVFASKVVEETSLEQPNLNMVFMGNPGTGKTTVAKILAKIFYELGYAKVNKVAEVTARDFIAEYVGQTAIKAKNVINQYRGGVIFIDEAYVFSASGQAYADEALVEIIKEMEKRETIFIFAGYKEEMKQFIQMNPGLTSRIGYQLDFKDYTLEELYAIFLRKLKISKLHMDEKIGARLKLLISDFMKQEHFGNGRFIDNLFDKIVISHASRCYNSDDLEELTTLTEGDITSDIYEELKTNGKTKKVGF